MQDYWHECSDKTEGTISGQHLSVVLLNTHFLILRVVYRILDKEFINNYEWYRVPSDIPLIFLVMSFLAKPKKSSLYTLYKWIFKAKYLGNIDKVFSNI